MKMFLLIILTLLFAALFAFGYGSLFDSVLPNFSLHIEAMLKWLFAGGLIVYPTWLLLFAAGMCAVGPADDSALTNFAMENLKATGRFRLPPMESTSSLPLLLPLLMERRALQI